MSLSTLVHISLGIGVVGLGASIWMERRMQGRYKRETFYRESVKLLQNYPPASRCLGKPIYSGRVKLGDRQMTNIGEFTARLVIPVTGPLDKGLLYVQASKKDKEVDWSIDQLDLELKGAQRRWTFYKRKMNESSETTDNKDKAIAHVDKQS